MRTRSVDITSLKNSYIHILKAKIHSMYGVIFIDQKQNTAVASTTGKRKS